MSIHLCQPGFETFLAKELGSSTARGEGWVEGPEPDRESCFAHLSLAEPAAVAGATVKPLAAAIADAFLAAARDVRFEGPWPFCVEAAGVAGLSKRASMVEDEAFARIKARVSRVAKLAVRGRPGPGSHEGLFVFLPDAGRAYVSRKAWAGGQRRMADDAQAPSRSYLKAEEAYVVLGRGPAEGETVVDLGAAPGGWSYSAAKRGATVDAVDNGPLKGGAIQPRIVHRPEDAFKFVPEKPVDWLYCDMVEDPFRIADLLEQWLKAGRCRSFVVNLKFNREDPFRLLDRARKLKPLCDILRLRHLYHDREELTVVGTAKGDGNNNG